jgi:hypothetical protein
MAKCPWGRHPGPQGLGIATEAKFTRPRRVNPPEAGKSYGIHASDEIATAFATLRSAYSVRREVWRTTKAGSLAAQHERPRNDTCVCKPSAQDLLNLAELVGSATPLRSCHAMDVASRRSGRRCVPRFIGATLDLDGSLPV